MIHALFYELTALGIIPCLCSNPFPCKTTIIIIISFINIFFYLCFLVIKQRNRKRFQFSFELKFFQNLAPLPFKHIHKNNSIYFEQKQWPKYFIFLIEISFKDHHKRICFQSITNSPPKRSVQSWHTFPLSFFSPILSCFSW